MAYDPEKHHRRSIRLQGYDYSQQGAYYVTFCVNEKRCLFGTVRDEDMVMNAAGAMIDRVWNEIPTHYPGVDIDAYVVMPNHFHGIIVLPESPNNVGAPPRGCPFSAPPRGCPASSDGGTVPTKSAHVGAPPRACPAPSDGGPAPGDCAPRLSVFDVVERFKSFTTNRCGIGVREMGWPRYRGKLWQRNYYEHIIRDDKDYARIAEYIETNPQGWATDEYHN